MFSGSLNIDVCGFGFGCDPAMARMLVGTKKLKMKKKSLKKYAVRHFIKFYETSVIFIQTKSNYCLPKFDCTSWSKYFPISNKLNLRISYISKENKKNNYKNILLIKIEKA